MNIECGDLLSFNDKKYITLKKINYNYKTYLFVNEIIGDDVISDSYDIFELRPNAIVIINDNSLKRILLAEFEKVLVNDINLLI